MTHGVPTIDLDLVSPRVVAPVRTRRVVLPIGMIVLVLALVAGSVAPPPRLERALWAGGQAAAAFVLGPDALYIAQFGANPHSESVLRSFGLADGELRWSGAASQNVQNLVLDAESQVLMGRSGEDPRIVFLDAATGDELWRAEIPNSTVVALAGGAALIRTDLSATETSLRLVDARTGAQIWQRPLPAIAELGPEDLYTGTPERIVAVAPGGHVTTLRRSDGSVLAEGELGVRLSPQPETDPDPAVVHLVGDRVYLSRREGGGASLTAFSTVPWARLWRADVPVDDVRGCGVVVCVTDERSLSGLDPASGALRWTAPGWQAGSAWDSGRVLAVRGRDESPEGTGVLLDAATGRVLRRLGPVLTMGRLLLHQDATVAARTWVRVVGRDGAPHAVGWVDSEAAFGCAVRGSYLACPTTAGPTGVWRVPAR